MDVETREKGEDIKVGDAVRCFDCPGSWVDGKEFAVIGLDVVASDGIRGHLLQGHGGITVVPGHCLKVVRDDAQ